MSMYTCIVKRSNKNGWLKPYFPIFDINREAEDSVFTTHWIRGSWDFAEDMMKVFIWSYKIVIPTKRARILL